MADWADEMAQEIVDIIDLWDDAQRVKDYLSLKLRCVEGQGCVRGIELCQKAADNAFRGKPENASDGKPS